MGTVVNIACKKGLILSYQPYLGRTRYEEWYESEEELIREMSEDQECIYADTRKDYLGWKKIPPHIETIGDVKKYVEGWGTEVIIEETDMNYMDIGCLISDIENNQYLFLEKGVKK